MSKKLCKDTEIKAFSHWHFEFSMARFWAVPVFSNEVWTIWSAYATADYPARPRRPHGQTYQHKSPLDNGEIFLFSRSWLVGLWNRCWITPWIKGLGKNPQNKRARSLFAVPFVQGFKYGINWGRIVGGVVRVEKFFKVGFPSGKPIFSLNENSVWALSR